MEDFIFKLEKVWKEEEKTIDYTGLKEVKSVFDQGYTKLRHLVTEWERRKLNNKLTDHLTDMMDKLWDQYDEKYQSMADIKRSEYIQRRQKEKELLSYKNEKRRPIPSWPNSIPYTKFKPDLISWDKENHMSTGAFKFGQMVEMLKKEGIFESQIT